MEREQRGRGRSGSREGEGEREGSGERGRGRGRRPPDLPRAGVGPGRAHAGPPYQAPAAARPDAQPYVWPTICWGMNRVKSAGPIGYGPRTEVVEELMAVEDLAENQYFDETGFYHANLVLDRNCNHTHVRDLGWNGKGKTGLRLRVVLLATTLTREIKNEAGEVIAIDQDINPEHAVWMRQQLAASGNNISDKEKVQQTLNGLGHDYYAFIIALEVLPVLLSFNKLQGKLLQHEMNMKRVIEMTDQGNSQNVLAMNVKFGKSHGKSNHGGHGILPTPHNQGATKEKGVCSHSCGAHGTENRKNLKSTPDFRLIPNATKLVFEGSTKLGQVHESIVDLQSLVCLNSGVCWPLDKSARAGSHPLHGLWTRSVTVSFALPNAPCLGNIEVLLEVRQPLSSYRVTQVKGERHDNSRIIFELAESNEAWTEAEEVIDIVSIGAFIPWKLEDDKGKGVTVRDGK
ncbi:hypothetical protein EJ110_NYTH18246 [Nymphaea thermarum]|nr:hypothetical protein EJ110_NYTH18246 [Nymphaea thermarum]